MYSLSGENRRITGSSRGLVIRRNSLTGCHVCWITSTLQANWSVLVIRPFAPDNKYSWITSTAG